MERDEREPVICTSIFLYDVRTNKIDMIGNLLTRKENKSIRQRESIIG